MYIKSSYSFRTQITKQHIFLHLLIIKSNYKLNFSKCLRANNVCGVVNTKCLNKYKN